MYFGTAIDQMWQNVMQIFSPYLIAAFLGYFTAQSAKVVVYSVKYRKFNWHEFFQSGGMPSSHAATVMALMIAVGINEGLGSPVFAVSLVLAVIVVYDATHVRRATDEQGEVLRQLIDDDYKSKNKITKPYFARGHKPSEVAIGSLLGIIIGTAVALLIG